MSFSTALIGGVGGAIIGFFAGGTGSAALQGLQYGTFVGALFDQSKTPTIVGPRITDLTVQTSTYGAVIPRLYGMTSLCGNIFWLENNRLKEVAKKNKSGGKGGGGSSSYKTYSYYATFALGLCEGPIAGVRRIWINKKLFYNVNTTNLGTMIASNASSKYFTLHTGSETQPPDSRMQATLGLANTPAYRGLAYLVFKDLHLKDFGNSLSSAQIKVEVIYNGLENLSPQVTTFGDLTSDAYQTGVADSDVMKLNRVAINGSDYTLYTKNLKQTSSTPEKIQILSPWLGLNGAYPLNAPTGAIGVLFNYSNMPDHAFKIYTSSGALLASFNPTNGALGTSANYGACITVNGLSYIPKGTSGVAVFKSGGLISDVIVSHLPDSVMPLQMFSDESDGVYINNGYGIYRCHPTSLAVLESFPFSAYTTQYNFRCRRFNYFYSSVDGSKTVKRFEFLAGSFDIRTAIGSGYGPFIPIDQNLVFAYGCIFNFGALINQTDVPLYNIVSKESLQSDFLTAEDIDVTGLSQNVRGYMLSSVAAIRAGLQPLQGAFPFDIIQSGYKIKFKPRGSLTVATIPAKDLGAVDIT